MEKEKRMNILVIGPSGSGKSTLIKAVSGQEVLIGTGEGQTNMNITVVQSIIIIQTFPLKNKCDIIFFEGTTIRFAR